MDHLCHPMRRPIFLLGTLVPFAALAQVDPEPSDRIIPGLPPDAYVDVTSDGIADLLITGRTVHVSDPEQPGYLGKYTLGVRTLAGTSVLMWSTPSNQRWYTVNDSAGLDTAELAARIHFKQLSWTDPDRPTEFWLLERPFGPAITKDQDGWYGTGEHYDGTLVLRNANERGTGIAAFAFHLPYPYGRVVIDVKKAVPVPNGFGEEGDPMPIGAKVIREFDFGHEAHTPQVIIPPGIPPDEWVDLNSDDVPDAIITGTEEHWHGTGRPGHYVRGIAPAPGTSFLMTNVRWGTWGPYVLEEGQALTPEQLARGLEAGTMRWAPTDDERVMIDALKQPFGLPDLPQEWTSALMENTGDLVYRTTTYGRPIIGAAEIHWEVPGGVLGLRPRAWVEAGEVLEVR